MAPAISSAMASTSAFIKSTTDRISSANNCMHDYVDAVHDHISQCIIAGITKAPGGQAAINLISPYISSLDSPASPPVFPWMWMIASPLLFCLAGGHNQEDKFSQHLRCGFEIVCVSTSLMIAIRLVCQDIPKGSSHNPARNSRDTDLSRLMLLYPGVVFTIARRFLPHILLPTSAQLAIMVISGDAVVEIAMQSQLLSEEPLGESETKIPSSEDAASDAKPANDDALPEVATPPADHVTDMGKTTVHEENQGPGTVSEVLKPREMMKTRLDAAPMEIRLRSNDQKAIEDKLLEQLDQSQLLAIRLTKEIEQKNQALDMTETTITKIAQRNGDLATKLNASRERINLFEYSAEKNHQTAIQAIQRQRILEQQLAGRAKEITALRKQVGGNQQESNRVVKQHKSELHAVHEELRHARRRNGELFRGLSENKEEQHRLTAEFQSLTTQNQSLMGQLQGKEKDLYVSRGLNRDLLAKRKAAENEVLQLKSRVQTCEYLASEHRNMHRAAEAKLEALSKKNEDVSSDRLADIEKNKQLTRKLDTVKVALEGLLHPSQATALDRKIINKLVAVLCRDCHEAQPSRPAQESTGHSVSSDTDAPGSLVVPGETEQTSDCQNDCEEDEEEENDEQVDEIVEGEEDEESNFSEGEYDIVTASDREDLE